MYALFCLILFREKSVFIITRYEWWTGDQLRQRFDQFTTDGRYVAVYNKDGGLVDAAAGNAVHVQLARGRGASVIENCRVLNVAREKDGRIKVLSF